MPNNKPIRFAAFTLKSWNRCPQVPDHTRDRAGADVPYPSKRKEVRRVIEKITTTVAALVQSATESWPKTVRLCMVLLFIALVIAAWRI